MHCKSLVECFEGISAYANGAGTGYPLIVNAENFSDYQEIMHRLSADETKQCIYVSDHTFGNGLPNIHEVLEIIRGNSCYVVSGISQSLMLQGADALDRLVDTLIGCSIRDHAIIVLSHCRLYLEKYMQRDIRLANRIILIDGVKSTLPQLRILKTQEECTGAYEKGIKSLLSRLERVSDQEIATRPTISVLTDFTPDFFKESLYAVVISGGIYDTLVQKYPDLGIAADRKLGTDDQWAWLFSLSDEFQSFSELIRMKFGSVTNLTSNLSTVLASSDDNTKWLLWLALKVFGADANGYLSTVLSHTENHSSFEHHIYQDLLDIPRNDERFETFYKERKQLISRLPVNLPEVSSYCASVGRHGKDAAFYLTDATEDEEFSFMELVSTNEWTDEELCAVATHAFPALGTYLKDFTFDPINTKLSEKDAPFRKTLTDYFHRYKVQKIKNHIDPDFLDQVNKFAADRPFYKLQPRSSIVTTMDKTDVQAYFFDALGVEYLSYIQAKCEEYGLIYEIAIAHCELPSITVKNKEFQQRFDTKDIGDLDELKHHSLVYDYTACEYPIHIFRELEIIDQELLRIRSKLIQNNSNKAVILSDHGASRLAVIYKHENESKIELDEKGEHSGRCCPCDEDPCIPQATYEDGYAVLANYERFKGGRKANLEVHGGASLEEVVVPIITVSLKPDDIVYYFVDPVVRYKVGQPSTIELFSNAPMKQPRLEVDGTFYDGTFSSDTKHAVFVLTEQKRVREYSATVYEGNTNTGIALTFRIERGTKTRDLF